VGGVSGGRSLLGSPIVQTDWREV